MDVEAAPFSEAPLYETDDAEGWAGYSNEDWEAAKKAQIGWKTLVIAVFISLMAGLAIWSSLSEGANISPNASFLVFGIVAAALAAFAFAPAVLEHLGGQASGLSRIGRAFYVLAVPVILVDKVLRGPIAFVCGLGIHHPAPRYMLLIAHVGLAASLIWVVPRYWPEGGWLGYVGLAWALVALVAVVRKWTWVENQYERKAAGFDADEFCRYPQLRDEALTAVLLFFFCVPVVLWKFDGSFHLFERADGAIAAPLDWIALFGGELVKAIPLVDWAEVYDVGTRNALEPIRPFGQSAVFATRVIVDLVLIGALLYAVERVGQISRQWQEFLAGRRRLLDPYLEQRVFRVLKKRAGDASWFEQEPAYPLGPFAHYDGGRLRAIALKEEEDQANIAISLHAAFQQGPASVFTEIASSLVSEDRAAQRYGLGNLLLSIDLLGRSHNPTARHFLGKMADGFAGYAATERSRLLERVATALASAWRGLSDDERSNLTGSEVVQFLSRGMRNGPNLEVRTTYVDQLVMTGTGEALDAIADYLEEERAAQALSNFARGMKSMRSSAPPDRLRRPAEHSRLRAAKLQAREQRGQADETAIRDLNAAALDLDQAADEREQGAAGHPLSELEPA